MMRLTRVVISALVTAFLASPQSAGAQDNILQILQKWHKIVSGELDCIDRELHKSGTSVQNLVRRGVPPNDPQLSEIRRACSPEHAANNPAVPQGDRAANLGILIPDGQYLNSQKDCAELGNKNAPENPDLLVVSGNTITGWESQCVIRNSKFSGNGADVKASCSGEGETRQVTTKIARNGNEIDFGKLGNTRPYVLCELSKNTYPIGKVTEPTAVRQT